MSQAELGVGYCSVGYISLLESGLREPTPDVIQVLARRLRLAPADLGDRARADTTGGRVSVLEALSARQAWDVREYADAAAHAAAAAQSALDCGSCGDWWNMKYMQAESLLKLGRLVECLGIAQHLLEHPLVARSTGLAIRARLMIAEARHGLGQLDAASEHAREAAALSTAQHPTGSADRIGSLDILIRALADSGRLDEAWAECRTLESLIGPDSPGQLAGHAAWVIGNVAFMRSDYEGGIRRHELASRLLSPASDLELWGRFNRTAAAARLTAGIIGPETLAAIERAEKALEIVGGSRRDRLEVAFLRARWLYCRGEIPAAAERVEALFAEQELLGHDMGGEVSLFYGRVLADMGFHERARELVEGAQRQFVSAGAWLKASQCTDAGLAVRVFGRGTRAAQLETL